MARTPVTVDPRIERVRAELAGRDDALLEAFNERLRLVAELKAVKEELGVAFVDHEQERRLLERLTAANAGPASDEALRELFETVLALTKRELEQLG